MTITTHSPFADNCDSFIPYNPSALTYTTSFGAVDVAALGMSLVDDEHLHEVVFTMGLAPTSIITNKAFYDCNGVAGCTLDGILTLDNATSLDIY